MLTCIVFVNKYVASRSGSCDVTYKTIEFDKFDFEINVLRAGMKPLCSAILF